MKAQILCINTCHDCEKDMTYVFMDNITNEPNKPRISKSELFLCQNCMESYLIFYTYFMEFPWAIELIEKEHMLSRRLTDGAQQSREWRTAINIARGLLEMERRDEVSS